jgi:hypothetical protein
MTVSHGVALSFLIGCSSGAPTASSDAGGGSTLADSGSGQASIVAGIGNAQTPPQGMALVEAWLATGAYKAWACEPAVHASRSPSPHGFNRICSNDLISTNATSTAPWPEGAAGVKELWASDPDAGAVDGAPPRRLRSVMRCT